MTAVIKGFGKLDKKLAALGNAKKVQKMVRQAVVFALTPVVNEARKDIPEGSESHRLDDGRVVSPGYARRSIKKKTQAGRPGDTFFVRGMVGVRRSAWYSLLFDQGYTRADGSQVSGTKWLTDAGKNNADVMIARFEKKLAKALLKDAKKNV